MGCSHVSSLHIKWDLTRDLLLTWKGLFRWGEQPYRAALWLPGHFSFSARLHTKNEPGWRGKDCMKNYPPSTFCFPCKHESSVELMKQVRLPLRCRWVLLLMNTKIQRIPCVGNVISWQLAEKPKEVGTEVSPLVFQLLAAIKEEKGPQGRVFLWCMLLNKRRPVANWRIFISIIITCDSDSAQGIKESAFAERE